MRSEEVLEEEDRWVPSLLGKEVAKLGFNVYLAGVTVDGKVVRRRSRVDGVNDEDNGEEVMVMRRNKRALSSGDDDEDMGASKRQKTDITNTTTNSPIPTDVEDATTSNDDPPDTTVTLPNVKQELSDNGRSYLYHVKCRNLQLVEGKYGDIFGDDIPIDSRDLLPQRCWESMTPYHAESDCVLDRKCTFISPPSLRNIPLTKIT